jgi:general secretion pathway protein I
MSHDRCHLRPVLSRSRRRARRGFTLPEVLATLLLLAIVIPSIMKGISLSTAAAGTARQRSEATALAESKLNELVTTGQWQSGGLSGDFGQDWPEYRWEAAAANWEQPSVRQLQVRVLWFARGRNYDVALSTLAYSGSTGSVFGTSGTTGGGQQQ